MRIGWWTAKYDGQNGVPRRRRTRTPHRRYAEPSFIDPDSDGDGVLDGNDDQDHDGYPNWFEARRPTRDWATTRTRRPGRSRGPATPGRTNPLARVNPFNPCKPIYSDACHATRPLGYYEPGEDWPATSRHPAPPIGRQRRHARLARTTSRDRSRATAP